MKVKTVTTYDQPHKCSRCNHLGEAVHMVPVLGSLVHPMCAVALVGEDGLAMSEAREAPFTVADLIAALQKLPSNMRVMKAGYEGGYHDCTPPTIQPIKLNKNSEWYYGPHDDPGKDDEPDLDAAIL